MLKNKFSFTFDLEDSRPNASYEKRFSFITEKVLDLLAEHQAQSTFFVVGKVAETEPALIKKIASLGHEIAFHSYQHTPLDLDSPENFYQQTQMSKAYIEDLTGQPVVGFRAPIFSLTSSTRWVTDILLKLGFQYSSSVLPAENVLYGYAGAPTSPFLWENGLIEIPCPLLNLKIIQFPCFGGIYLRYFPVSISTKLLLRQLSESYLWTYCHPYDFDPDEPFFIMNGTNFLTSLLLWLNRRNTFKKVSWLLNHFASQPMAHAIQSQSFKDELVLFKD